MRLHTSNSEIETDKPRPHDTSNATMQKEWGILTNNCPCFKDQFPCLLFYITKKITFVHQHTRFFHYPCAHGVGKEDRGCARGRSFPHSFLQNRCHWSLWHHTRDMLYSRVSRALRQNSHECLSDACYADHPNINSHWGWTQALQNKTTSEGAGYTSPIQY